MIETARTGTAAQAYRSVAASESSTPVSAEGAASGGRYREAVRRLSSAQKPATGAPAYSRFVNRRLGRRLAALAYALGRTPNQVTCVSAAFTFSGIVLVALAPPGWGVALTVTVLLLTGYALDAADGQLARLRGGGSVAGEWLDHIVDSAKECSLHLAVLISMFRYWELSNPAWLLIPVGFTLVATVMFFGTILNDLLRARHSARTGHAVVRTPPSTMRSLLVIPTDYGFICLSFLLLGWPTLFLGAYTLLFAGNAGFMLLAARKWFNDMRSLDQVSRELDGAS